MAVCDMCIQPRRLPVQRAMRQLVIYTLFETDQSFAGTEQIEKHSTQLTCNEVHYLPTGATPSRWRYSYQ